MQKALAPSFKKKTKMKQKDKQLIQNELSAMFQYGVKCKIDLIGILNSFDEYKKVFDGAKRIRPNLFDIISNKVYTLYGFPCLYRVTLLEFDGLEDYGIPIDFIKPYLRPISSMTNEEINKLFHILKIDEENTKEWIKVNDIGIIRLFTEEGKDFYEIAEAIDYLHSIHIDYRGLIEMGLALEASEEMYNQNKITNEENN